MVLPKQHSLYQTIKKSSFPVIINLLIKSTLSFYFYFFNFPFFLKLWAINVCFHPRTRKQKTNTLPDKPGDLGDMHTPPFSVWYVKLVDWILCCMPSCHQRECTGLLSVPAQLSIRIMTQLHQPFIVWSPSISKFCIVNKAADQWLFQQGKQTRTGNIKK